MWCRLAIVCLIAVLITGCTGTNPGQPRIDPKLGVSMFLWYGFEPGTGVSVGGLGSEHWNSNVLAQTGIYDPVVVTPELGYYASDDPAVIARQVEWMREVGIDFVAGNYWGWGDDELDGSVTNLGRAAIDRAHKALFEHLEDMPSGQRIQALIQLENFMIPFEQWDAGDPVHVDAVKSQMVWNYIWDEYVTPYPNAYMELDGKPLVVSGAPHILAPDDQDRFAYKTLWPVLFNESSIHQGTMDWSWIDPAHDPDVYKADIISPDRFVTITPRHDQYWGWITGQFGNAIDGADGPRRRDPFLIQGLYDENWKLLYEARGQVEIVFLATWNDYHEMSFIEPAKNGPLGSVEPVDLMEKTKWYWGRFKAGEEFELYEEKR